MWYADGLGAGNHTLVLTNLGSATSPNFDLDYLKVTPITDGSTNGTSSGSSSSGKSKSNGGLIGGVVGGVVGGLLLLGLLLVCLVRRRRKQKREQVDPLEHVQQVDPEPYSYATNGVIPTQTSHQSSSFYSPSGGMVSDQRTSAAVSDQFYAAYSSPNITQHPGQPFLSPSPQPQHDGGPPVYAGSSSHYTDSQAPPSLAWPNEKSASFTATQRPISGQSEASGMSQLNYMPGASTGTHTRQTPIAEEANGGWV